MYFYNTFIFSFYILRMKAYLENKNWIDKENENFFNELVENKDIIITPNIEDSEILIYPNKDNIDVLDVIDYDNTKFKRKLIFTNENFKKRKEVKSIINFFNT